MDDKAVATKVRTKPTRSLPVDQEKVRTFIKALLSGKPADAAADEAGYDHRAIRGLLRRREVLKAIRDENRARDKTVTLTPAKVLSQVSNLAFSDIGELFEKDMSLKPLHSVNPDTRAAISAINMQEFIDPDTGQVSRRFYRIQMEKKQPSLDSLSEITRLTDPDGSVHYNGLGFSVNIHLGPEAVRIGQEKNAAVRPAIETTSEPAPPNETRN
jgi:phage terminase small subunit